MYFRCAVESKPTWNGRSRVLFQNKNTHMAEIRRRTTRSRDGDVNFFKLTRQRTTPPQAIPISKIQSGQIFFAASRVSSPSATGLPRPGVFAAEASAAFRHDEPANDASQFSSVRLQLVGTQNEPERWRSIVVEHAHLDDVGAPMKLLRDVDL